MSCEHGHATWFNRHPVEYAAMARVLSLDKIEHPTDEDVDVICFGCSSGRTVLDQLTELYLEFQRRSVRNRVHMTGVDICPEIIDFARKGEYKPEEGDENSRVMSAPWMTIEDGIIKIRWDILETYGWTLDYQVFDLEDDLREVQPGRKYDLVEAINDHFKGRNNPDHADNICRALKPNGVINRGKFIDPYFRFAGPEIQFPPTIPNDRAEFMRNCTDRQELTFITGITGCRRLTKDERDLLAKLHRPRLALDDEIGSLSIIESFYELLRFSDYLYSLKEASSHQKRLFAENSDLLRYLYACAKSPRGVTVPKFQEQAFELYFRNEEPTKQKNFEEFFNLTTRIYGGKCRSLKETVLASYRSLMRSKREKFPRN